MESESTLNSVEKIRLNKLADDLDILQKEKGGEQGHSIIQKLIKRLRSGNAQAAKLLCGNESDKFSEYRGDGVPLIIEGLYSGTGSPWFSIERRLRDAKEDKGAGPR